MRITFRIMMLAVVLSGITNLAYTIDFCRRDIQINARKRILVAPYAISYQWYFNNEEIPETGQQIQINEGGQYTVVVTDEFGLKTKINIQIGINQKGEAYRIYLIGDSTMCNWASGYFPLTGWGQVLDFFFDSTVVVDNRALSARSAKSFYNDHWAPIRDALVPGDYVFIQFGINDAKSDDTSRYSEPFTTFKGYLTSFVNETQARGAHPVLVTTVRRNAWNETTPPTVYNAYHDYPVATRQLAGEINVPLIDLDQLSVPLLEGLGPDYVGPFMYLILDTGEYAAYPTGKTDNVHFQEMGAIEMARLAIQAMAGFTSDTNMNKLIPHIKPMHEVVVSTNFPDGAMITRTASYPQGLPVTVKAKIDPAYDLLRWEDEAENLITKDDRYRFTMGNENLSYIAILDDDPEPDCAGVLNGEAYTDSCGVCVGGTTRFYPCYTDVPDDTFKITVASSGLCLQETFSETYGETKRLTQEICKDTAAQSWIFIKVGEYYMIKNLETGLYITAEDVSAWMYLTTSEDTMYWRLEMAGTDTIQIVPSENINLNIAIKGSTSKEGLLTFFSSRNGILIGKFILHEDVKSDCVIYPDLCTSVREYIQDIQPGIIPNPFSNEACLSLSEGSVLPYDFALYTLDGKNIFSIQNISGEYLFGKNLPQGIYIGKVTQENKVWTFKVIKR